MSYNPSLRSDVRQAARDTGSGAALFFWGIMGTVMALGWAGHNLHRFLASPHAWAWAVAIVTGIAMIAFVTAVSESNPAPPGGGVPRWTPQPARPDLRQTRDAWETVMSAIDRT